MAIVMYDYNTIILRLLKVCRNENYCGYNKHDGLLSPVLSAVCRYWKYSPLGAIQLIMRSAVNVRRYFGIPKTRNPKGIGLFAHAFLEEAIRLLSRLEQNASKDYGGLSWGYQYLWQDVGFFAPANFPNRVVTCWMAYALATFLTTVGKEHAGKRT